MIGRALIFFFWIGLAIAVALFLADRPGRVEIVWGARIIETSVAVMLIVVAGLMLVAALLYRMWRALVTAPRRMAERRAAKRRARGYQALTQGMVAVAAGDPEAASRSARRADVLLNEPPLTLLLSAQAAQLSGDEGAATRYFRQMLEREETRFLGLRGLLTQALRAGDREEALRLAREARRLNPSSQWVLRSVFQLELEARDWRAAGDSLTRAARAKAIPAPEANKYRAALLLEQSRESDEADQPSEALALAEQAAKLDPDLAPATIRQATALARAGRTRKALKRIERAWARQPHPALAEAHAALDPPEADPVERVRRRERLLALAPDHPESRIAMAEAEMKAKLWGAARSRLTKLAEEHPGRRVFRMLADLELAEKNDARASRDWLARAEAAAPEDAWICTQCGSAANGWAALCPSCGAFDTIAWTSPKTRGTLIAPAPEGAPSGAALPAVRTIE